MNIKVSAVRVPVFGPSELADIGRYVSADRMKKIKRYRKVEDQWRSLAASILCRTMLCRIGGFGNQQLKFEADSRGKPRLVGANHLHFNLSHSGEWAVCAVFDQPLGIDVESVEAVSFAIRRYFHNKEQQYLDQLRQTDQREALCRLWTLKESYLKACGDGLYRGFDNFVIDLFGSSPYVHGEETEWLFSEFSGLPGYKLSICARGGATSEFQIISWNELIGEFERYVNKEM